VEISPVMFIFTSVLKNVTISDINLGGFCCSFIFCTARILALPPKLTAFLDQEFTLTETNVSDLHPL